MEGGACPLHQAATSRGLARLLSQELVCMGPVPVPALTRTRTRPLPASCLDPGGVGWGGPGLGLGCGSRVLSALELFSAGRALSSASAALPSPASCL